MSDKYTEIGLLSIMAILLFGTCVFVAGIGDKTYDAGFDSWKEHNIETITSGNFTIERMDQDAIYTNGYHLFALVLAIILFMTLIAIIFKILTN